MSDRRRYLPGSQRPTSTPAPRTAVTHTTTVSQTRIGSSPRVVNQTIRRTTLESAKSSTQAERALTSGPFRTGAAAGASYLRPTVTSLGKIRDAGGQTTRIQNPQTPGSDLRQTGRSARGQVATVSSARPVAKATATAVNTPTSRGSKRGSCERTTRVIIPPNYASKTKTTVIEVPKGASTAVVTRPATAPDASIPDPPPSSPNIMDERIELGVLKEHLNWPFIRKWLEERAECQKVPMSEGLTFEELETVLEYKDWDQRLFIMQLQQERNKRKKKKQGDEQFNRLMEEALEEHDQLHRMAAEIRQRDASTPPNYRLHRSWNEVVGEEAAAAAMGFAIAAADEGRIRTARDRMYEDDSFLMVKSGEDPLDIDSPNDLECTEDENEDEDFHIPTNAFHPDMEDFTVERRSPPGRRLFNDELIDFNTPPPDDLIEFSPMSNRNTSEEFLNLRSPNRSCRRCS